MMDSYDCVVIGRSLAGVTAATLVAQAGFSVLLIDESSHDELLRRGPRIGDRLPGACVPKLQRLGLDSFGSEHGFQPSAGLRVLAGCGNRGAEETLAGEDDGALSSESATAWHVVPSELDRRLFTAAQRQGVRMVEGRGAMQSLLNGSGVVVRLTSKQGQPLSVSAAAVVDLRNAPSVFVGGSQSHASIWGYYENVARDAFDRTGGATVLRTVAGRTWFWRIPLADGRDSIGVAGDAKLIFAKGCGEVEAFEEQLVQCPSLLERLVQATFASGLFAWHGNLAGVSQPRGRSSSFPSDAEFAYPLGGQATLDALQAGEHAAENALTSLRTEKPIDERALARNGAEG